MRFPPSGQSYLLSNSHLKYVARSWRALKSLLINVCLSRARIFFSFFPSRQLLKYFEKVTLSYSYDIKKFSQPKIQAFVKSGEKNRFCRAPDFTLKKNNKRAET